MFTIIRIMLSRPLDRRGQRRPQVTPDLHSGQSDDDLEDGRRGANPWKKELDRLANTRDLAPINPLYRRASQLPSPKKRAEQEPGKGLKQGTLTDLSAWWGKALTPQTLAPGKGRARGVPPKSIKWWQQ